VSVPASTTHLQGFTISSDNQTWVEAQALIDNNTVIVFNPQMSNPIAVRYAWGYNPVCNLYNKENLPASPFRTDDGDLLPTKDAGK